MWVAVIVMVCKQQQNKPHINKESEVLLHTCRQRDGGGAVLFHPLAKFNGLLTQMMMMSS